MRGSSHLAQKYVA